VPLIFFCTEVIGVKEPSTHVWEQGCHRGILQEAGIVRITTIEYFEEWIMYWTLTKLMDKKSAAKNAIGLLALPVWKAPGTNTPPNQTARRGIGTSYATLLSAIKEEKRPFAAADGIRHRSSRTTENPTLAQMARSGIR